MSDKQPLRVGIGGPVGSGKTALLDALCKAMRDDYQIEVVTNDIYTQEDAQILMRAEALPFERILGVETGGCPHTAIREDASMNLAAVEDLQHRFPGLEIVFIESGGDNLSATFSPELADLTIYVIDVAEGEKIPRKGGPGITRSDLLVINKIDLAPYVGASAFAHKAGLHASAILKDPSTYEHIDPALVGNARIIPMSNQAPVCISLSIKNNRPTGASKKR